jgi:hypothetical protein
LIEPSFRLFEHVGENINRAALLEKLREVLEREWIREARRDRCHEVDRCASESLQWSRHFEERDGSRRHATSRDFVGNAFEYRTLLG